MKRRVVAVLTGLCALGLLWGFIGLWWWALFGMSWRVSTATLWTTFPLALFGGLGALCASDLMTDDESARRK